MFDRLIRPCGANKNILNFARSTIWVQFNTSKEFGTSGNLPIGSNRVRNIGCFHTQIDRFCFPRKHLHRIYVSLHIKGFSESPEPVIAKSTT